MNNVVSLLNPTQSRECASCGQLTACRRDLIERFPYQADRHQVMLEASVPVWECSSCKTKFTDGDAEEIRHAAVCRYLGRLEPKEVRAIRDQYKLSQQDWASQTGLGLASIKRWETGNLIQGEAYDRYLRLLKYPDIFARVAEIGHRPMVTARIYQFQTELSAEIIHQASVFQLRKRQS